MEPKHYRFRAEGDKPSAGAVLGWAGGDLQEVQDQLRAYYATQGVGEDDIAALLDKIVYTKGTIDDKIAFFALESLVKNAEGDLGLDVGGAIAVGSDGSPVSNDSVLGELTEGGYDFLSAEEKNPENQLPQTPGEFWEERASRTTSWPYDDPKFTREYDTAHAVIDSMFDLLNRAPPAGAVTVEQKMAAWVNAGNPPFSIVPGDFGGFIAVPYDADLMPEVPTTDTPPAPPAPPGVVSTDFGMYQLPEETGEWAPLGLPSAPASMEYMGNMLWMRGTDGSLSPVSNVLERMIEQKILEGDWETALQWDDFRNRPSPQQHLESMLEYARTPADQVLLSAIARGYVEGIVPPQAGSLGRVGPIPQEATAAWERYERSITGGPSRDEMEKYLDDQNTEREEETERYYESLRDMRGTFQDALKDIQADSAKRFKEVADAMKAMGSKVTDTTDDVPAAGGENAYEYDFLGGDATFTEPGGPTDADLNDPNSAYWGEQWKREMAKWRDNPYNKNPDGSVKVFPFSFGLTEQGNLPSAHEKYLIALGQNNADAAAAKEIPPLVDAPTEEPPEKPTEEPIGDPQAEINWSTPAIMAHLGGPTAPPPFEAPQELQEEIRNYPALFDLESGYSSPQMARMGMSDRALNPPPLPVSTPKPMSMPTVVAGRPFEESLSSPLARAPRLHQPTWLAGGGVVQGPTLAILGEKEPEFVVPLSKVDDFRRGRLPLGNGRPTATGSTVASFAEGGFVFTDTLNGADNESNRMPKIPPGKAGDYVALPGYVARPGDGGRFITRETLAGLQSGKYGMRGDEVFDIAAEEAARVAMEERSTRRQALGAQESGAAVNIPGYARTTGSANFERSLANLREGELGHLPVGVRQVLAGRSPRPLAGRLLRQAGMALPSAQAWRNLSPDEQAIYTDLARQQGISEGYLGSELQTAMPSGGGGARRARMLPLAARRVFR